jgi:pre-mRNA-processing factor 19
MTLCSISGQPPVHAVVSLKSGHVFEKSLIEKHLQVTGKCPVTKEDLTPADLMPLQGNSAIQPRPPSATSVPGLIQLFQTEWDAVMLETYTLKQHLETVRQELAHALYQHDAACRVIARLIAERDEARAAVGNTQENVAVAMRRVASGADGGAQATGITEEMGKVMQQVAKGLSKNRKKKVKEMANEVTGVEDIKKFKVTESHPLHSPSQPGVLCLDVHAADTDLVLTGGADSNAIVLNKKTGKIVDTLKGHKKKITAVKFHPTEQTVFTTSEDGTGAIWGHSASSGRYTVQHTLKDHTAAVTACTLHPSGSYLITASLDKSWCFYDITTGTCRQKVTDDKVTGGYTQAVFHPDGLILGCGTEDSIVRIFDVKSQKNVANFKGHTGAVTALAFSENGYYAASGDQNGVVKLWDLRKLSNFETLNNKGCEGGVNHLEFDASGTYLAMTGKDVSLYTTKAWELVKTWSDHTKDVTALKFGLNAASFITTSKDRSLKVWSA